MWCIHCVPHNFRPKIAQNFQNSQYPKIPNPKFILVAASLGLTDQTVLNSKYYLLFTISALVWVQILLKSIAIVLLSSDEIEAKVADAFVALAYNNS